MPEWNWLDSMLLDEPGLLDANQPHVLELMDFSKLRDMPYQLFPIACCEFRVVCPLKSCGLLTTWLIYP